MTAAGQAVDTVDVGGHKLEVVVQGSGLPVVVFEAGLGNDRTAWDGILPLVAEFTTAVAYTRAGYPGSEVGPEPRSPGQISLELQTLLRALDLPPPYVLVGHSLGALFVRAYYYNQPDEVGALVLVDGSHERQFKSWQALDSTWNPWAPNSSLASFAAQRPPGARGEVAAWLDVEAEGVLPNSRPLSDLPVYILTALRSNPTDTTVISSPAGRQIWRDLHAELFSDVKQGAHIITSRSGHRIQDTERSLVVWAVREAVDALRVSGGSH
jgi:pimeloyl-ACP methyl ester carboxylesterase